MKIAFEMAFLGLICRVLARLPENNTDSTVGELALDRGDCSSANPPRGPVRR
jgi:hypothetical protein